MRFTTEYGAMRFAVIGSPVGHSLSPAMHNTVYREADLNWVYEAIECPTEEDAAHQIDLVRMGHIKGLNVTMPYKRLALEAADWADPVARAAGGANVLVRHGYELWAYNTDGMGAVDAVQRAGGLDIAKAYACVCGTGPTSSAIACALAVRGAKQVTIFSRDIAKAELAIVRLSSILSPQEAAVLQPAAYGDAFRIVPQCTVFIDATPRGMEPGDEPIVDPRLFNKHQVVMDVVYNHGLTTLVEGARKQGAVAIDGGEMLVGQAALAIEIWQQELGYDFPVDRELMRAPLRGKHA